MTVLVHFSGPSSYSKTAVLQPGAAPIEVGRDPTAGIYLPDQDRLISRRHISLQWDAGGVKVTVLSKVNGVTTPRGEFNMGDAVVLAPGETGQIGRFTFVAEQQSAAGARAAPAEPDPFHAFSAPATGPSSMFDDPFFLPTREAPTPQIDTPAALEAMSGQRAQASAGFSGASTNPQNDPLAAFGGNQPPVHSSVSIDEFLGAPSGGSGLGASQLLRADAPDSARRLATDHVHDFNLPVQAPQFQPQPASGSGFGPIDAWATPAPSAMPTAAPAMPAAPAPAAAGDADPWAAFAQEWVPDADQKKSSSSFPPPNSLNRALDDAFSSSTAWRVEDMPSVDPLSSASFQSEQALGVAFSVPGTATPAPSQAPMQSRAPAGMEDTAAGMETALRALCRGLGITGPPQMREKEWEQLGRSIRQIVQGMSDLMNVRAELKKEMRAVDRTMLGAQENNPLKSGMPIDELLHYVLFMAQGIAGYMPVQRALEESIDDLRAHEFASLAAARAVVEGSIREFDPGKLRTSLLKGKRSIAGMLDNARLWDLYSAHYEKKGEHMADWLEQVFSRHFMPTYTRESERMRREAQAQRPTPTPPNT